MKTGNRKTKKTIIAIALAVLVALLCESCSDVISNITGTTSSTGSTASVSGTVYYTEDDEFSKRDLKQTADLADAIYCEVADGEDITITAAGVYVVSGSATDSTIIVEAGDEDKVQIVLNGVTITNTDFPCIYVKSADKVFVTTAEDTDNTLKVTGAFTSDGDTNTDAVIFAKDDIVLNGEGTLNITSTYGNGITGKDDLKITGGTISITCKLDAIEAHDSIRIAGGDITINSKKDGLHAEYDEDDSVGYIYICGGTLDITASDDGIHATTVVQIDDGEIGISAAEGIEGTYVLINGGTITISASDDGINAASKSTAYSVAIEINGGTITIKMGSGDTDAIDSNGNLYVNGGTLNITATSAFDYDGGASYTGGTIIVNGQTVNTITNSMMGGAAQGGSTPGGQTGGPGGRF
ncbi:MAG: carbohydrate-binding domain-containing protein [Spirochaetales bacterium]|nr:carbohydrate-binding domain-containing protein [Spirochaetales bacterium]